MFVYVISKDGQPLMPTSRFGKVRRLLKNKKAKENYKFTTWTADRDITLNDGTVIAAGTEMSKEQVELSVIDRETTFTAHFNKTVGSLRIIKESK